MIEGRESAILAGVVNGTKYSTQFQSLDGVQFCINVTTKYSTLILVICVGHHVTIGVAIVLIPITIVGCIIRTAIETVVVAGLSTSLCLTAIEDVGCIYRRKWRSAKGATQRVVVLIANTNTCRFGINKTYLLTNLQFAVKKTMLRIDAEVVTFIVRYILTANNTLLIHIAQRKCIG